MKLLYFDHAATTPVRPEVIRVMTSAMQDAWQNPSSLYDAAVPAQEALSRARSLTARLINARPEEIIFTSGGTESDNMALLCASRIFPDRRRVLVSAIEHPAVLRSAQSLALSGFQVEYIAPDKEGIIRPEALQAAIRPDTGLVSVMAANNEVGSIQPIRELARIAHEAGALFHTDAVQAYGQIPIDVRE